MSPTQIVRGERICIQGQCTDQKQISGCFTLDGKICTLEEIESKEKEIPQIEEVYSACLFNNHIYLLVEWNYPWKPEGVLWPSILQLDFDLNLIRRVAIPQSIKEENYYDYSLACVNEDAFYLSAEQELYLLRNIGWIGGHIPKCNW